MKYPSEAETIWQFDTANFRVVCHVDAEDVRPEDSFSEPEDVAFAREDNPAHWFCAFVSVWYGDDENNLTYLAHDVLGGCSYRSFDEFVSSHRSADPENRNTLAMKARNTVICHYFPDMVRQAVAAARTAFNNLGRVTLRAA